MDQDIPFEPLADNSKPRHAWFDEQVQYRVKVRTFRSVPPEVTIQRISFEKDYAIYRNAYEKGYTNCGKRGGRASPQEAPLRSQESIERSARRAKINLRLRVTELAPTNFCTFTTRETGPDYFTADNWREIWANFVRLIRLTGNEFEYVAVLERHPSNPQHLHLHVAFRGSWHYNLLRRFWHMAIGRFKGEKVTKMLRGVDAPGGIKDVPVKASRGSYKQFRKIAKYISKYITKDAITEFARKSYMHSKGINLQDAKVYWLDSLDYCSAVKEGCLMLGQWDDVRGCAQKMFMPSPRLAWFQVDPDLTPSPPF
jgi:hypothetical protein